MFLLRKGISKKKEKIEAYFDEKDGRVDAVGEHPQDQITQFLHHSQHCQTHNQCRTLILMVPLEILSR